MKNNKNQNNPSTKKEYTTMNNAPIMNTKTCEEDDAHEEYEED